MCPQFELEGFFSLSISLSIVSIVSKGPAVQNLGTSFPRLYNFSKLKINFKSTDVNILKTHFKNEKKESHKLHLKWWELLCGETGSAIQSPSDGPGCDKLPAHMVLSLVHLGLVCLSLQAEMPSVQPSHIPILCSHHIHPPKPSPSASFGPLGPRQEKTRSCTHTHTPFLSFTSCHLFYNAFLQCHLPSHTDNPSGLVVGDGANSALWCV